MLNFGLIFSVSYGGGVPPIIQGDYIYYQLDPQNGFCTDELGKRYIADKGNTFWILPVPNNNKKEKDNGSM